MSVLKIKDQNNNWTQIPTIKGDKGDPFTYADFTPEQLESLKGKDGISPTVSVASDTSDDYRLSFTDETHTVTTPNLIPEAEKILSVYPHDTASGAVASFVDGADDIPLKSCIVQVNPVQDLHGYDSPWPAGGGKNKFDITAYDSIYTSYDYRESSYYCKRIQLKPNTEYTVSFTSPAADSTCIILFNYITNVNERGFMDLRNSNDSKTYTTDDTGCLYIGSVNSNDADYNARMSVCKIQIEEGSTATDWTPYSNECPITGWTGCEVQRTGKNIFGGEAFRDAVLAAVSTATTGEDENGRYVTITAGPASNEKILLEYPWKENTVYTFIYRYKKNDTNGITNLAIYYKDGTYNFLSKYGGVEADTVHTEVLKSVKNKLPSDVRTIWGSGVATIYYDDFGVFEGDISVADFAPYQGQTYPITFPSEAGTVYGAYIDVINGVLTINKISTTIGALTWTYQSSYPRFYTTSIKNVLDVTEPMICEALPFGGNFDYTQSRLYHGVTSGNVFISFPSVASVSDLISAIGDKKIVYSIKEPITMQLDAHTIKTLLGQNNLWANTGDTEVEYRADVTKYISKKITEAVSALT